jgi:hypothetical protein
MKKFKVKIKKTLIAEVIIDWVDNKEDAIHEADDMVCDEAFIRWEEDGIEVLQAREI